MVLSAPNFSHAQSASEYRKNGVTIVNPIDAKPYSFMGADGQPKGFLIDYWEKWSNETGVPVSFRLAPWEETLSLVADGECDIHGALFATDERRQYLDFSQSFFPVEGALFVLKNNREDSDTIFAEYTIGVESKGAADRFMQDNHPETKTNRYDESRFMFEDFVDGNVGAIITDLPTFTFTLGRVAGSDYFHMSDVLYTRNLHAGVRKGNMALLWLVKDGLSQISAAERRFIANYWFVPGPSQNHFWVYVLIAMIALAAILSGVVIYRRYIRSA